MKGACLLTAVMQVLVDPSDGTVTDVSTGFCLSI